MVSTRGVLKVSVSMEVFLQISRMITSIIMLLLPVALILKQPNLGTSTIILLIGAAIFFMGGVRAWKFITVITLGLGSLPVIWHMLHDYQRQRVLTFMDPESDPLGAGYNIMQSMIAIGSGGNFALAAARALMDSDSSAEGIARKAMAIASDICVYTNGKLTVETIKG